MTLLDRYLGSRFLSMFLRVIIALVFLFILIDLLTNLQKDISKHEVPWIIVVQYYAVSVPQILFKFQLTALAVLVSGLLVLGKASQHNEITAALAGGISLGKIVRMPILISLLVTLTVLVLQETIGPLANQQLETIKNQYFSQSTNMKRTPVSWTHLPGQWSCHIMKFNKAAMTGEQVLMHSIREDAVEQIQARRIFWDDKNHRWMLEDGFWYVFDPNQSWQKESFRLTQYPAPIGPPPEDLFALDAPAETKNAFQLLKDLFRAESRGVPVYMNWVDFYTKFSQPTLSFIMIWLAIPFSIRIRRGGLAVGFGVSVAIAVAYMILYRMGLGLGYIGKLQPFVAAWLANVVFLSIGFILYRKTAS